MDMRQELQQLGLGDKQARLYLAVLELGSGTVTEIARKAEIKRVTAYGLIEDLADRRLIALSPKPGKRLYVAEDPRALRAIPQRMQERIEQILPGLYASFNTQSTKPKVRAYEGIDGIKTVWEELLNSKEKAYRYIGSTATFLALADEAYLNDYSRRRAEAGIWSYGLRSPSSGDAAYGNQSNAASLREIRYLAQPLAADDLACLYVSDDKVAIQSGKDEVFAIVIQSKEIAALLRPMWQLLWDSAAVERPALAD